VNKDYQQQKRRPGCRFCANPQRYVIDYKNVRLLERAQIAREIKRAREIALLPYTVS